MFSFEAIGAPVWCAISARFWNPQHWRPVREHLGAEFERYMAGRWIRTGDITEPGLVGDNADEVVNGSIDAVIHSAGLVNFEASLEKAIGINTIGAANVIEFCRAQAPR